MSSSDTVELSMVEDAVDDMYMGCAAAMEEKIKSKYRKEFENNDLKALKWLFKKSQTERGRGSFHISHANNLYLYVWLLL